MDSKGVEAVFSALNRVGARYLVVGGLAVVAHGFLRATLDVDIVLSLDPENVRRALMALSELKYRPRAPVPSRPCPRNVREPVAGAFTKCRTFRRQRQRDSCKMMPPPPPRDGR